MNINKKIEEEQKFFEIEKAHKLTTEMEVEAEKYKKLASLALYDEIRTIKDLLRGRWLHLTYPIKDAQKWLSMKNEKIDNRKKYEEKDQFDYLTHQIEDLLDSKIEITDISVLGYDESAFYIHFELKENSFDREFELTIPEVEKLNKNNLNELLYGKVSISVRDANNPCSWDSICLSYSKDELKNKFKEFLTPKPKAEE